MRVVQVLTNLDLGGAQQSVVQISGRLQMAGVDVGLVYSSEGGREGHGHPLLLNTLERAGIPVFNVNQMYRSIRPLKDLRSIVQLAALFNELRPSIVHTHMSKAGILGRLAGRISSVPVVIHSVRGWSFNQDVKKLKRKAYSLCERLLAHYTDKLAAVSVQMIRDGLQRGIGTFGKYTLTRTGIDRRCFAKRNPEEVILLRRSLDIPQDAGIVGSIMGLTPSKSPLEFIDVCETVLRSRSNVHVVIVGDGEMREAVEHRISTMDVGDRIHLTGHQQDIGIYLELFDVFLLTSRWEGLPRVVLEALGAGLDVVATDVGGTWELLPHTENLHLERAGAIDALADGVLKMLDGMASSSRERGIPAEYLLSNVARDYYDLYIHLLRDKP